MAELRPLIDRSVRMLQSSDYTAAQIEAALGIIFAVDTQLVRDGTYLVAESDGVVVGCGAWSRRGTLFGGDTSPGKNDRALDPATEPARIRGFFIEPAHARKGISSLILDACESAARDAGFTRFELMATMTGVPLYLARGYTIIERLEIPLPGGVKLPVRRMAK